MLYIGYLIIKNGQNINKKIGFGKFPFLSCTGCKTKQVVPQPPRDQPPAANTHKG